MAKDRVAKHPSGWRALGQWLLLAVATVSVVLWARTQSVDTLTQNPLLSVGRVAGTIGLTLYALNIVLATRFKIYEKLFGGLNRVYRVHHTVGGIAFIFMLSHPILVILANWQYPSVLKLYLVPSRMGLLTSGYTWGMMAIWMTIVLLSITYWARIPYQWWKRTHYFMGFIAVPLFLHVLLVPSDTRRDLPLKWWLLSLLIVATLARGYKFIWLRYVAKGKRYKIADIRKLRDVTEVTAFPDNGKIVRYLPGQFAFVTYHSGNVSREEHPFSISTYDEAGRVRFSMKQSGDFTKKLNSLKRGDLLYIHGPYGIFGHAVYETTRDLVMIAGGIGITPFLSHLYYLAEKDKRRKVTFFYSVKQKQEAVYMKELLELKKQLKNLRLCAIETDQQGVLTAETILKKLDEANDRCKFLICGPPAMQHALTNQLTEAGIKNLDIETELFSL